MSDDHLRRSTCPGCKLTVYYMSVVRNAVTPLLQIDVDL